MIEANKDTTISYDVKVKIIKEFVEPLYIDDIKSTIANKKHWKTLGQIFETISKILVALGGILSFSSGYYNNEVFSYLSGCVATISLAMLQLSSFSFKENKKQSEELNVLLKKLGLDTVPVFDRNTEIQSGSKQLSQMNENINKMVTNINTRNDQIIKYLEHNKNEMSIPDNDL